MNKFTDWVILIFLEIGFSIYLGPLPISEYITYIFVIFRYSLFKSVVERYHLEPFCKLLFILIGLQLLSDTLHSIDLYYILRGTDSLLMGLLHLVIILFYLRKNKLNLIPLLIGASVMVYISADNLMQIDLQEDSVSNTLEGEDAPFLKFIVAPILSYLLMIICLFLKGKTMLLIAPTVGIVFIILGARSAGLILLLASLLYYASLYNFLKRHLFSVFMSMMILGYSGYVVYVNYCLNSKELSGNNEQVLQLENPYNPLSLLILGRSEVYVGTMAMLESPLIGHSSRPLDVDGKYNAMRCKIKTGYYAVFPRNLSIPCHSIIFGVGMQYGVIALFVFSIFLYRILKMNFRLLFFTKIQYGFLLSFVLAFLSWNILFSPIGHFKWTLPIYFSIVFFYYKNLFDNKTK